MIILSLSTIWMKFGTGAYLYVQPFFLPASPTDKSTDKSTGKMTGKMTDKWPVDSL